MTIKISYTNKPASKTSSNTILFVDEKFSLGNIKRYVSNSEYSYINDLVKTIDLKKNIFAFELNSKKKNNFNFNKKKY